MKKKSLLRLYDIVEFFISFFICFSINIIFSYVSTIKVNSYMLHSFLAAILEYQDRISTSFTLIVIVVLYDFIHRKKTEVFCRILVGDTIQKIMMNFFCRSIIILVIAFMYSIIISLIFNFDIIKNIRSLLIIISYLIITTFIFRNYENI